MSNSDGRLVTDVALVQSRVSAITTMSHRNQRGGWVVQPPVDSLTFSPPTGGVSRLVPTWDWKPFVTMSRSHADEVVSVHPLLRSEGGHSFFDFGMCWSTEVSFLSLRFVWPPVSFRFVHLNNCVLVVAVVVLCDAVGCCAVGCAFLFVFQIKEPEIVVLAIGFGGKKMRVWGDDAIAHDKVKGDPDRGVVPVWTPLVQLTNTSFHQLPLSWLFALMLGFPVDKQMKRFADDGSLLHAGSHALRSLLPKIPSDFAPATSRSVWCACCGGTEFSSFFCRGVDLSAAGHSSAAAASAVPSAALSTCSFALCKFCGARHLEHPTTPSIVEFAHERHSRSFLAKMVRLPLRLFQPRSTLIIFFMFIESVSSCACCLGSVMLRLFVGFFSHFFNAFLCCVCFVFRWSCGRCFIA